MTTVLAVLVVCLTVLALWWRVERIIGRILQARERRHGLGAPDVSREAIPPDLRAVANRESEAWAVADIEHDMMKRYARFEGPPEERWNRVREAYGVGSIRLAS